MKGVELTTEEIWLVNLVGGQVKNSQTELQRQMAAKDTLIELLEKKYDAVFNRATAEFEPKKKE